MPGQIRIDDLAHPRLTSAQEAAVSYGENQTVELTVDAVLAEAAARTGLDDFGPDDFTERLSLWLEEMDGDEQRTGLGRLTMFGDCTRYAGNRLRVLDLLARQPDIHDAEIRRPIIVVGLPRSGTTHLVNLLAADQRLRSLPLWESYEPVPDEREGPGPAGVDPRWHRCQQSWQAMQATLPHMVSMHPMAPDHIHEELELETSDFSSYQLEWVARCPRWRDYYLAHDQTPHYQWLLSNLKILQWRQPRERWVLKSPQHLEQFPALLATFPDATFVVTHRDPVSVTTSMVTMLAYSARLGHDVVDLPWIADYWLDRLQRMLKACVQSRDVLPASQSIDVHFDEFMRDDVEMVRRIYDLAGQPFSNEAQAAMTTFMAEHPRGRHGGIIYDPAQFGFDRALVTKSFRFYTDRFGVSQED